MRIASTTTTCPAKVPTRSLNTTTKPNVSSAPVSRNNRSDRCTPNRSSEAAIDMTTTMHTSASRFRASNRGPISVASASVTCPQL